MRKAVRLELNEAQRKDLERGYRMGERHCFRMRCLSLLLKAEGLSASEVGARTGMEQHTVRKWLKRYEKEGIKGLEIRPLPSIRICNPSKANLTDEVFGKT